MNSKIDDADLLLKKVGSIEDNPVLQLKDKFNNGISLLDEIIDLLIKESNQFFTSRYSKILFITDRGKFSRELKLLFFKVNRDIQKFSKKSLIVEQFQITRLFYLMRIILGDERVESKLKVEFDTDEDEKYETGLVKEVTVYARKKIQSDDPTKATILVVDENATEIKLDLYGEWLDTYDLVWKNCKLNLFNVKSFKHNYLHYAVTSESIIVIEPDYLFDATDLAECFTMSDFNPNIYFIKRYFKSGVSVPLMVGNIVNNLFDKLLFDENVEFDSALKESLLQKPIAILALLANKSDDLKNLRTIISSHYTNLKRAVRLLQKGKYSIEPTFLSPKYGIQGRLDLFIEGFDDENEKNVVELKSGKAPKETLFVKSGEGKSYAVSMWLNHLAQVTCYNLLLDSIYENRNGYSTILYSGVEEKQLRNAANIIYQKQKVIQLRNWIIALKRSLSKGVFKIFESFNIDKFGAAGGFLNDKIRDFDFFWKQANQTEKDYFLEYSRFLFSEQLNAKIGVMSRFESYSQKSLWSETIEQKQHKYAIANELTLDVTKSDLNNFYLYFDLPEEKAKQINFRMGDQLILWNSNHDNPTDDKLLKCVVKAISSSSIVVSLRNKITDLSLLENNSIWNLEIDITDMGIKNQFPNLLDFLTSGDKTKELLLGNKIPESEEIFEDSEDFEYLNHSKYETLKEAINAKNYYLIQGPPGTGKTTFMLKALVQYYFTKSTHNILLVAFTNRAVDEICTAISKIEGISFLRMGNKEASEHQDVLISKLLEDKSLQEVSNIISKTRVFAATSAFINSNPEFLQLKKFNIGIIDEASQMSETQIIGLLSKLEKFIMIGDEKQLPAIATSDRDTLYTKSNNLKKINILNLADSIFERFVKTAITNNWTHAYGMLKHQARMHSDIYNFVNKHYYSGELRSLEMDWQSSKAIIFDGVSSKLSQFLNKSRMIFIDTPRTVQSKQNELEAKAAVSIVEVLFSKYGIDFDENLVGIISPFRSQVSLIKTMLPNHLLPFVTVDTVERFQGGERRVIIYSTAVNLNSMLDNISSETIIMNRRIDRKLNVTITRAKESFILLGGEEILKKSMHYENLIKYIRNLGGIGNYSEIF